MIAASFGECSLSYTFGPPFNSWSNTSSTCQSSLATTLKYIALVKARHSEFLMSDLGPLRYFLEIEVSSTSNDFFIF